MTRVRHRVGTILAFAAIAAVIAIAGALLQTERLGLNLLLAGVYLAGLAVGAMFFTARPEFCAFLTEGDPSRRATVTWTPLSFRFSACAWPWLP